MVTPLWLGVELVYSFLFYLLVVIVVLGLLRSLVSTVRTSGSADHLRGTSRGADDHEGCSS